MRPIHDLKFVIIGSSASGTGFMHRLLTNCGINTGHESVFSPCRGLEDELMDNDLVGDSSHMAVPWLERGGFNNTTVVHVVRDTLSVVRSLVGSGFPVGGNKFCGDLMSLYLPDIKPILENRLEAALFYYSRWNDRCERLSHFRVRVEDLSTIDTLAVLLAFLGVEASEEQMDSALHNTPINHNSRTRGSITWDEIVTSRFGVDVKKLARRYGYPIA